MDDTLQMRTSRAVGRRYEAIALLAWRQHEVAEYELGDRAPGVWEFARKLGWDLPHRQLMEAKPWVDKHSANGNQ